MAVRGKGKMDISNRAKQFMPFAALKGLPEALEKKEKIIVPRPILSEDRMAQLDYKMRMVTNGMVVSVTYYEGDECLKKTGMVARLSKESRILQIVDKKISFDAILDMEIESVNVLRT